MKLKQLLGIRARLILLALILVVPLMADRVRVLENMRASQSEAASVQLAEIARRGADAQRDMMSGVKSMLRSSAQIFTIAQKNGQPCGLIDAGFKMEFESIGNLSIASKGGKILCSTMPNLVGIDVSDRPYFHQALDTRQFVLSNYLVSKRYGGGPSVVAAYPTAAVDPAVEGVVITSVSLDWLENLLNGFNASKGTTTLMIDGEGTVLATRPSQSDPANFRPIIDAVLATTDDRNSGSTREIAGAPQMLYSYVRLPGTDARLIVTINAGTMFAALKRDIMAAYLQLGLVGILVLMGAWFVGDRLIVRPIRSLTMMAQRFGEGDMKARAGRDSLPTEFMPLANAFNAMAGQLAQREHDLLASNDKLAVLASVDELSDLANRRGFDSRLTFEWMKGEQTGQSLSLMMIDIDHFKPFNDTYGHLDGDGCLRKVSEALARIANQASGFAARYGGEEFSIMLPGADAARATAVGESVRAAIEALAIPHIGSTFGHVTVSIGVATALPNDQHDPKDLVEAADAGLYAAKRRGRNTVVEHGSIRTVAPGIALAG